MWKIACLENLISLPASGHAHLMWWLYAFPALRGQLRIMFRLRCTELVLTDSTGVFSLSSVPTLIFGAFRVLGFFFFFFSCYPSCPGVSTIFPWHEAWLCRLTVDKEGHSEVTGASLNFTVSAITADVSETFPPLINAKIFFSISRRIWFPLAALTILCLCFSTVVLMVLWNPCLYHICLKEQNGLICNQKPIWVWCGQWGPCPCFSFFITSQSNK